MFQLWKESLICDGKQFHQYQQNEQSPLILIPWSQCDVGNPDSGLGQA